MNSAIKAVTYYTATDIQCCDRCGQVIKNVGMITYADGLVQRYGWDCIDKVLATVPDLKTLFRKNARLLCKYRDYLAVLTGAVEAMPRGREYYGSGLYFIADSAGSDVLFGTSFFHPVYDVEKNSAGRNYVIKDPAQHVTRCSRDIEEKLPRLRAEIERIEKFLIRVLTKATKAN